MHMNSDRLKGVITAVLGMDFLAIGIWWYSLARLNLESTV